MAKTPEYVFWNQTIHWLSGDYYFSLINTAQNKKNEIIDFAGRNNIVVDVIEDEL